MADEPESALRAPREVRNHASNVALRINVVSAFLGKMQHNFPLKQSRVDVAHQAVNVHLPNVMIGDESRSAWHLDAVFQIEVGFSSQRIRGRRKFDTGENPW